jgi:hypothetical protein
MSAETITTVVKMLEALPEAAQERVAEHLRDYLTELQDEWLWNETYASTQTQLVAMAKIAKDQIATGRSLPLHFDDP